MHKFVVVTDGESAIGFRLAGVDAYEASGPGEARSVLRTLGSNSDIGVIAINEDILASLDEKFRDELEKMRKPIVIPMPSKSCGIDKKSYMERLLRKAIGYNIVIRR